MSRLTSSLVPVVCFLLVSALLYPTLTVITLLSSSRRQGEYVQIGVSNIVGVYQKRRAFPPMPLCDYTEGHWLKAPRPQTTFTCCPWDPVPEGFIKPALCQQLPRMPKNKLGYTGTAQSFIEVGGHGCYCQMRAAAGNYTDPIPAWVWRPRRCVLLEWNTTRFCQALGGRRLLLIGDSHMQQLASTLMALVRGELLHPSGLDETCVKNIVFAMADTLVHRPFGKHCRGVHWRRAVETHLPSIVIVNAGAHFRYAHDFSVVIHEFLNEWPNVSNMVRRRCNSLRRIAWT